MREKEDREHCRLIQRYLDNELDEIQADGFEKHMKACRKCRKRFESFKQLSERLPELFDCRLPDEVDLEIRRRLNAALSRWSERDSVLDLEGAARLLSLPVTALADMLDELPAFEVNGRIRFLRERLLEWARERERKLMMERAAHTFGSEKRFFVIEGGAEEPDVDAQENGILWKG